MQDSTNSLMSSGGYVLTGKQMGRLLANLKVMISRQFTEVNQCIEKGYVLKARIEAEELATLGIRTLELEAIRSTHFYIPRPPNPVDTEMLAAMEGEGAHA